jgi:quercetin dioxygenase-like cupin family protein
MSDTDGALRRFREEIKQQREPLPRPTDDLHLVVHADEVEWFESAHNPAKLGPVLASPMRSFELFLQELEPGGSSDMQQHHHEAVHYVISGHGYSELGGKRYDWASGDFVCVPPMVWHRHYNASDTAPVKMLLIENSRLLEALGLNYRVSVGRLSAEELEAELARRAHAERNLP